MKDSTKYRFYANNFLCFLKRLKSQIWNIFSFESLNPKIRIFCCQNYVSIFQTLRRIFSMQIGSLLIIMMEFELRKFFWWEKNVLKKFLSLLKKKKPPKFSSEKSSFLKSSKVIIFQRYNECKIYHMLSL